MSRIGGFAGSEEVLDDGGRKAVGGVSIAARFRSNAFASLSVCSHETAEIIGLSCQIEPALADVDWGVWSGRSFEDVMTQAPAEFAAWMADATGGAPGGETFHAVGQRVGGWLDGISSRDEPVFAITQPMVIRAAIARALDLPLRATLAIDVAPLSSVVLSYNRNWRLQSLAPVD